MNTAVILRSIGLLLQILAWLIVARSLLSWLPNLRGNAVVEAINSITEPILSPLRRIVPTVGFIDITPMIATLVLFVLSSYLLAAA